MTGHPHPFVAAATAIFDEQGWPYLLTEEGLTSGFENPLRHGLGFSVEKDWVVLDAMLDAKILEGHAMNALLVANRFNIENYCLQSYVAPLNHDLHPFATVALPASAFDETHATRTVARFMMATVRWVEWWMEHADLLEFSPEERWHQAGVRSPWADLLAEAGFLPEDADGVDDIEAFAMEILVEHCSAVDPPPHT